jgi:hypothetical protein
MHPHVARTNFDPGRRLTYFTFPVDGCDDKYGVRRTAIVLFEKEADGPFINPKNRHEP